MSFTYPQPRDEDDFELFCLRLLREHWGCAALQLYGKRGERQDGIDLIDESGSVPLRAAQCKHHEPGKTIPPAEIEAEVQKALNSGFDLGEYHILTTARKTTHSQKAIIRLNQDHAAKGYFSVVLWVWADIEERLAQLDDATQERIRFGDSGRSGPAVCRMITTVMTEHLDLSVYGSASLLDRDLELVKAAIDRHELEVAESKLKEIESRAAGQFQPHHLYQLKALRSQIYSDRWEWEKAGRELIDAKRHLPDTERAQINEALGYELLGDRENAYAIATTLRKEYTHSAKLLTIWVRTAPIDTPFATVAEAASPFINDNEELNLALAYRAVVEERYEEALPCARRAAELDADSPHAWFVLGQVKHSLGCRPFSGPQKAILREAEEHYDRAARLARDQKLSGLEAAVRLHRGKVRHALGSSLADADFAAATELGRFDHGMLTEYASYLLELDRFADALHVLDTAPTPSTTPRLFYEAVALYGRNVGNDRGRAIELLRQIIAGEPGERWADAHVFLVRCAAEDNSPADARSAIVGSKLRAQNELVYHTLLGWLAECEGDVDTARTELHTAICHLSDYTPKDQVFLLAQALASVDQDAEAIPLFQRCYRSGVFNQECRKLLICAQRLNRHDVLVRVCRDLREAGEADPRVIQTEIQTLQLYDPQEALRVAQEYLATHPDNRHVTLWQSALALRLDRPSLVIGDLSRLPAMDDLTPEGTGLVLTILRETGQEAAILRYAYDALRVHFDSQFVHGQFVTQYLQLSDRCPDLHLSETAGPGMAVCYHEDHDGSDQWVVIEDGPDPELARYEFGPDHRVSRAITDRRIGDSLTISEGGIQPRTATVRDVVHKYIYRFRDCLNQFQVRFEGASAIQLVRVGSGDTFDPTPIIKSLEDRRRYLEWLNEQYRTQPVPLHCFAELSGRDEFEAWQHLAGSSDLGIRCSNGRDDDLRAGMGSLGQAKNVVLDLTALYTLANLDLLSVFQTSARSYVVAQTTFDRIRHLVDRAEEERDSEGSIIGTEGGRLRMLSVSPESRDRYAVRLAALRDEVRASCRIVPCPQAIELDSKRRSGLIQAIGRHNLDSMLLAAVPDTVLWTDDFLLGGIGLCEFRASRVWTQVVLFALRQEAALTQASYERAVARLVGWHYHGTRWNAETLLTAAELAEWNMDSWPVPQVMRSLRNPVLNPRVKIGIAAEAIRLAWRRNLVYQRQAFLFAVLKGLGSVRLVHGLDQVVPVLFSVDVFSADEVRNFIKYWLSNPDGPILP